MAELFNRGCDGHALVVLHLADHHAPLLRLPQFAALGHMDFGYWFSVGRSARGRGPRRRWGRQLLGCLPWSGALYRNMDSDAAAFAENAARCTPCTPSQVVHQARGCRASCQLAPRGNRHSARYGIHRSCRCHVHLRSYRRRPAGIRQCRRDACGTCHCVSQRASDRGFRFRGNKPAG